ncbi:MAG: DNA mismatch repair protein MutS [Candidatus Poribacteria bacterium]|nr:DNA mismatch repair protein MutS [Candidatus Poribacteria bacterium]MDE0506554.1 DNA mismatch repair protein MutS [Candidatus Poribacteria bacterium]
MAKQQQFSPLMEQYKRLKDQHADAILLCRVGDFYEAFYDDAELISRVLGITLTSRDKDSKGGAIPMAGVPHHAIDSYLYKLVMAGYNVAISEQMEDPKAAKGIVKRDVVRVVTPGTLTDPKALEKKSNNYLVAIYQLNGNYGLAAADLSTGEFSVTELMDAPKLWAELHRFSPKECLFSESFEDEKMFERLRTDLKVVVNFLPDWRFVLESARAELLQHFNTLSLDGFGCEHLHAATCAAGALVYYLHETQKQEVEHILSLHTYTISNFMVLDADTQRNLELTSSLRDASSRGTLLEVLDETVTPMGGRKLRQCVLQPLLKTTEIDARLESLGELKDRVSSQEDLREALSGMYDIERLISRVSLGSANARDLIALKNSLQLIPIVKEQLQVCKSSLLKSMNEELDPLSELSDLIEVAIDPEPPATVRDGGLIRDGYSGELDELRLIAGEGKDWIASLQQKEREKTGITSLKIGFNQVFGYYIEVTKANLNLIPEDYIRKQTLVNAERFITPELKERESRILNAEDQIQTLEYDLFCEIRGQVAHMTERIQRVASVVAMTDVIANLAYIASKYDYSKPIVDESDEIIIRNGRHPVVERLFTQEGFVPNDTELNCRDHQMHIITGPNMSGKSTYLRQTALITLLAQMGSFVPASAAKIGIVDRIFTRVGASDNLVMGQSTFLVEMNETANILNNATRKSLIVLDEIGRGTSTFDGLSIAWAVAEFILDEKRIGAKTQFATHYHELIELAGKYKPVKNFNVAVHEDGHAVTFLRKVVKGGTDQSYGIQVARLAGLPNAVIERAQQILDVLEQHNLSVESEASTPPPRTSRKMPRPRNRLSRSALQGDELQLALFTPKTHPVVEELRQLDLNQLSPLDALNHIYQLKSKAENS